MFLIVEFEENGEKTVYVIPASWMNKDKETCVWPPYTEPGRLTKAVRTCESPKDNWKQYFVRIIKQYDTYDMARKKLILSENTSNLESEDSSAAKQQRRIRKRKTFTSFDEDSSGNDEPHLKTTPLSSSKAGISQKKNEANYFCPEDSNSKHVSGLPIISPFQKNDLFGPTISKPPHNQMAIPFTQLRQNLLGPDFNRSENNSESSLSLTSDVDLSNVCDNSKTSSLENTTDSQTSGKRTAKASRTYSETNQFNNSCSEQSFPNLKGLGRSPSVEGTLKTVLRVMLEIKRDVTVVSAKADKLLEIINPEKTVVVDNEALGYLPLKTIQDLTNIENYISDREKRAKLVLTLASIGGKNLKTTTTKVLEKIFHNDLALLLNWAGRNRTGCQAGKEKKLGIKNMKITSVIFDSIRMKSRFQNTEDYDIEVIIKDWLKYSKDRNGGRARRNQVTNTQN